MTGPPKDLPPEPEAAINALTSAFQGVVSAVEAVADPQRAYEYATRLADLMRELHEAAVALRPKAAVRIWEEEKISLASLAARIGVSKARAGQLVQSARRVQDQPPDPTDKQGEQ